MIMFIANWSLKIWKIIRKPTKNNLPGRHLIWMMKYCLMYYWISFKLIILIIQVSVCICVSLLMCQYISNRGWKIGQQNNRSKQTSKTKTPEAQNLKCHLCTLFRLISAAFWQLWTPTSRFKVCITWRGWTCTPSIIWGSSLHTSLLWLTNATVASGSAMTVSVSSSG